MVINVPHWMHGRLTCELKKCPLVAGEGMETLRHFCKTVQDSKKKPISQQNLTIALMF